MIDEWCGAQISLCLSSQRSRQQRGRARRRVGASRGPRAVSSHTSLMIAVGRPSDKRYQDCNTQTGVQQHRTTAAAHRVAGRATEPDFKSNNKKQQQEHGQRSTSPMVKAGRPEMYVHWYSTVSVCGWMMDVWATGRLIHGKGRGPSLARLTTQK